MSVLKTGAEIQAMLDRTNSSVNLLQKEIGDYLNVIRKNHTGLPPFAYINFESWVVAWATFYEETCSSVAALNDGSSYDTAAQYLEECHKWRAMAVKDGALPPAKASDPYVEPPKNELPGFQIGAGIGTVLVIAGALWLLTRSK